MTKEERLAQDGAVDPVLFYAPKDDWGIFSNFSKHPVMMRNPWTKGMQLYRTTEHRYQAMKACNEEDHDYVLMDADGTLTTASESKGRGGRITLIDGWDGKDMVTPGYAYWVMFEACMAKALQHEEMRNALLDTRGRHLYEDSPTDDIWGWRYRSDYRGRNLLGKVLMQVRDQLVMFA